LLEYSFLEGELSAESVEEILQLFGNYHQLSEILKEKANTAGMILLHFHKLNTSFLYHSKNNYFIMNIKHLMTDPKGNSDPQCQWELKNRGKKCFKVICWTLTDTQICCGFKEHDLIMCELKVQVIIP